MKTMLEASEDVLLQYASVKDCDGSLSDSLVRESFRVLAYGMVASCLTLVWELRHDIIQGFRCRLRQVWYAFLSLVVDIFL